MALSRRQRLRLLGDIYKFLGTKIKRHPSLLVGAKPDEQDERAFRVFKRRMAKKYGVSQQEIHREVRGVAK